MVSSVRSYLCCLPSRRNMSCLPTSGWVMHFTLLNKHTCIFICTDIHRETHGAQTFRDTRTSAVKTTTQLWCKHYLILSLACKNAFPIMPSSLLPFFLAPASISHVHMWFSCPSTAVNRFTQCCIFAPGEIVFCREEGKGAKIWTCNHLVQTHKHSCMATYRLIQECVDCAQNLILPKYTSKLKAFLL